MHEIDFGIYLTTYSTLASTLAGAFGFLVAVVLFVMQGINSHISNCVTALVDGSPADRNRIKRLQSSNRWDDIIALHAAAGQHNPQLSAEVNLAMDEQFQEMRRAQAQLAVVHGQLSHSMYLTGTVIMGSIVGMPLTIFFLTPRSPVAVSILTLVIVCAMFCIRGYFRLMQAVLRR